MSPSEEIQQLQSRIQADTQRLADLQRAQAPQPVEDYLLQTTDEPTLLSEYFFSSDSLIVIHNMGSQCAYCTMWADGFSGLSAHLQDRAGLLLVSPDSPEVLEDFANSRGWLFPVASGQGSRFTADLGMAPEGKPRPGMSTFWKDPSTGQIYRICTEEFGPMDLYCSAWHMISRLKDGIAGWQPQFRYAFEDEVEGTEEEDPCGHGCGCHH